MLVGVCVVLGGVSLGLNRLAAGSKMPLVAAGPASPAALGFACQYRSDTAEEVAEGELTCRREAADLERRVQLTPAQLDQLSSVTRQVEVAVDTAVRGCLDAAVNGCVAVPARTQVVRAPSASGGAVIAETEPVVSAPRALGPIRSALQRAGFSMPLVRLARPEDPAPPGGVVYAVSAGQACVVGYQGRQRGPTARAVGWLQSGGCLTP